MQKLAGCLLWLSFCGCCSGPNWSACDRQVGGPLACAESPATVPATTSPLKPFDEPIVPPIPSEARWRTPPRRGTAANSDDALRKLTADLEKIKRDKSQLETKLTEETAKQTQQRLELEARLVVLQQQLQATQANHAVRQVQYQPVASISPGTVHTNWTNSGMNSAPAMWNPAANSWNATSGGANLSHTPPVEMWPNSPQR